MSQGILTRAARVPIALLAAFGCCASACAATASGDPGSPALSAALYGVRPLCASPAPGRSGCLGLRLVAHRSLSLPGTRAVPRTSTENEGAGVALSAEGVPAGEAAEHTTPLPGSLGPASVVQAYALNGATPPAPQTIALVDAYNAPGIASDLETFDAHFNLPACNETNGCFRKVNQNGEAENPPFPRTTHQLEVAHKGTTAQRKQAELAEGWALEIATDVEVAHGVCQSCRILLVEANTNENEDLYAAEQTAVAIGANEVSNSWGGSEPGIDFPQFDHPGVVITASAGDDGYLDWFTGSLSEAAEYPASSPHVVAVGGTRLALNEQSGAREGETVWNDGGESNGEVEPLGAGGGGCSASFAAPAWQQNLPDWASVGCEGRRAVADVAADADPWTGVAVYDSTEDEGNKGWSMIGGTSVASPIIASVFALAGGSHGVAYPASTLYENAATNPGSLHDVERGSNGECHKRIYKATGEAKCTPEEEAQVCSERAICLAGPGYDGPTGIGTPAGVAAFRPAAVGGEAAVVQPPSSSPQPPSGTSAPGTSAPAASASGGGAVTPAAPSAVVVTALRLTHNAIAAFARRRATLAKLGFAFTLSAPGRVRATLAVLVRAHGRTRWRAVSAPLSFLARAGAQTRALSGRTRLAAGRYRLTLTPTGGAARTLLFSVR
jgi:hypothetical protein